MPTGETALSSLHACRTGITGWTLSRFTTRWHFSRQTYRIDGMVGVEIAEVTPLLDGEILDVLPESRRKK